MKEIWEQAVLSYNLPLTALLGLVLGYWLLSLLGAVDIETFDIDLDTDLDVEGDLDANVGIMGSMLKFVNAQDVPLMLIISLLSLFMWLFAVGSNYYFNPSNSELVAFGLLVGNFIMSVLAVKLVTQPLRPLLRSIKNDQEHQEPLIGQSGIVKSRVLDSKYGQVEIARPNGAPALLNCRLPDDADALVRGDEILVIDHDSEKDRFLVKSLTSLTNRENSKLENLTEEPQVIYPTKENQ